jgi:hypothetical protein
MFNYIKFLSLTFTIFLVSGCLSPSIEDFKDGSPELKLNEYFDGYVEGWGIVRDLNGNVKRRFKVEINGSWEGNKGTLDEKFIYEDGEIDYRVWEVDLKDENNFTANTEDAVNEAIGKQYGYALNMNYTLEVPMDGGKTEFVIDDWMYRIDDKSVINISKMCKFGVDVATITIGFVKK